MNRFSRRRGKMALEVLQRSWGMITNAIQRHVDLPGDTGMT